MSTENQQRNSPILMLAPLVVVLLAYCYLYYQPQQRLIAAQLNKLDELQKGDVAADSALTKFIREHQEKAEAADQLREQLDAAKLEASALQDRQSQMLAAIGQSTEPARAVELTTDLLARHDLSVLESDTANYRSAGGAAFSDLLTVLKSDRRQPAQRPERHVCEIKVAGTFANLRSALTELASDGIATPLGLKMEPIEPGTELRVWVLTLLI